MPLWGKKDEELPPELKGKTPEQIAAALASAESAIGKVPTLESALAETKTALETANTALDEMRAKIAALDARTAPPPEEKKDEPKNKKPDWGVDADAAFEDRFRDTGVVSATLANTAILCRLQAEQAINGDPFDAACMRKWRSEIETAYNRCSVTEKANPATFRNIFDFVIGQHRKELSDLARDPEFMPPTGGPATKTGDTGKQNNEPTELEKLVAQRFGIKPDEYMAQKNRIRTTPQIR